MFTDLLSLAADQGMIVGMRMQPGTQATFRVHLWVGPRMGERMEWDVEFPGERERMAAIDEVAQLVVTSCRESGHASPDNSFAWGERVNAL